MPPSVSFPVYPLDTLARGIEFAFNAELRTSGRPLFRPLRVLIDSSSEESVLSRSLYDLHEFWLEDIRPLPLGHGLLVRIAGLMVLRPDDRNPQRLEFPLTVHVPDMDPPWLEDQLRLGLGFLRDYKAELSVAHGVIQPNRPDIACGQLVLDRGFTASAAP